MVAAALLMAVVELALQLVAVTSAERVVDMLRLRAVDMLRLHAADSPAVAPGLVAVVAVSMAAADTAAADTGRVS